MDVINTDFSKDFVMVDHNVFVVKIHSLGFRNPFHLWLVYFIYEVID